MAFLVYRNGPLEGKRVDLPDTGAAKFGRSPEKSDVVVSGETISGCHCLIEKTGTGYRVKDLDSTNNTWINGEIVSEAQDIFRGDELSMGDTVFAVNGDDLPERESSPHADPAGSRSGSGMSEAVINVVPRSVREGKVTIPTSFSRRRRGVKVFTLFSWVGALVAIFLLYRFFRMLTAD